MTFRHFYEACATIFVAQGVLLLPLLVLAGIAWHRQSARLAAVEAALGRDRARRGRTLKSLLGALPKLTPLTCTACGGVLSLGVTTTTCLNCRAEAPAPADYVATISLRRRLKRLTAAALFHWRLAWLLRSAPVRVLLWMAVPAEPMLFAITVVGAASYHDSWIDRLFERIGEAGGVVVMVMAFGAMVTWMVVFLLLANLSREVRGKLPASPVIAPVDGVAEQFSTCRSCGGGIGYDARAFAALCGYCGVENYRAGQSRRNRAEAEGERAATRASLFGAMTIIEDFTATLTIALGILVTGFALLVAFIALRG